ncbi:MAG: hypothetical protein WCI43_08215 [Candidatus Firestonebacteria bacterium]
MEYSSINKLTGLKAVALALLACAAFPLLAAEPENKEERCEYPVWSVKHAEKGFERIAYTLVSKVYGTQIWSLRADELKQKVMLTSKAWNRHPYWSWDGKNIAFAGGDEKGVQQLWIMEDDGGGVRQLTSTPEDKLYPVFSPGGEQIAFISVEKQNASLHLLDTRKKEPHKVLLKCGIVGPETVLSPPAWSPDMKQIAFVMLDKEFKKENIFIAGVATGEEKQVTTTGFVGSGLAWSPDGKKLIYPALAKDGLSFSLFSLELETREITELITRVTPLGVSFSPGGKKICFIKNYQIWSADGDGKNQRQLTAPEIVVDLKAWEVRKKQNLEAVFKLKEFVGRKLWFRKNIWTASGTKIDKLTECELVNVRNKIVLPGRELLTDKSALSIEIELKVNGKRFYVVYLNEMEGYLEDFTRFFFFENPYDSYKWDKSVWDAIKAKTVNTGMTKEQVMLSLGEPTEMLKSSTSVNELWDFKFVGTVSFENNVVKEFKPVTTILNIEGGEIRENSVKKKTPIPKRR